MNTNNLNKNNKLKTVTLLSFQLQESQQMWHLPHSIVGRFSRPPAHVPAWSNFTITRQAFFMPATWLFRNSIYKFWCAPNRTGLANRNASCL